MIYKKQLTETANEAKDQLADKLRRLIADSEELLTATSNSGDSKVAELQERVKDSLTAARYKLEDADELVRRHARDAAYATDDYVHQHPWSSIGVAAAAGLVIGLLIGRR